MICADSRARTGETGEACAVTVRGLQRSWCLQADLRQYDVPAAPDITGITAVACRSSIEAGIQCNGVMIQIPRDEISKFDEREVGYSRVELKQEDVDWLAKRTSAASPGEKMWVYVLPDSAGKPADADFPLLQSYVDVIMLGCSLVEEQAEAGVQNFATDFVLTTDGWPDESARAWVDDRLRPGYPRSDEEAMAKGREVFDSVLEHLIPAAFAGRYSIASSPQ